MTESPVSAYSETEKRHRARLTRTVLAMIQQRGMKIEHQQGKLIVTPRDQISEQLRSAIRFVKAELIAWCDRREKFGALADLPPEARTVPYSHRRWMTTRPIQEFIDDTPTWAKPKAEKRPPAYGSSKPAGPCPNCQGTRFARMTWGPWICVKCDPRHSDKHQAEVIDLAPKSKTAAA